MFPAIAPIFSEADIVWRTWALGNSESSERMEMFSYIKVKYMPSTESLKNYIQNVK